MTAVRRDYRVRRRLRHPWIAIVLAVVLGGGAAAALAVADTHDLFGADDPGKRVAGPISASLAQSARLTPQPWP